MDIGAFYRAIITQNAEELTAFFCEDAVIRWPCTNERFTREEYVIANCEYPSGWDGELVRMETAGERIILVDRIWPKDRSVFFHGVIFLTLRDGLIAEMDEYWGPEEEPPQWRKERGIGRPLCN